MALVCARAFDVASTLSGLRAAPMAELYPAAAALRNRFVASVC